MPVQALARILLLTLLGALLAGCVAEPVGSATPSPPFRSEAEAFAAAEATYRAYVDALNQVDLADPATFEAVYEWTTGEFNASERESLSRMHADGWTVSGSSVIESIEEGKARSTLLACVNVTGISLKDSHGTSQVSPERPKRYAMQVELVPSKTKTGISVANVSAVDSSTCK